VREVKQIKEKEDEKDSLFGKIKSQAAMEYLMTYGWAILIIALALGVLYSLGIMNPKNFLPRAPPGSCFVFRPNGPGTTDYVSLQGTCGYLPMYVASFNGVNGYVAYSPSSTLDVRYSLTVVAWVKWLADVDGPIFNWQYPGGTWGTHVWRVNGQLFTRIVMRNGIFTTSLSAGSIPVGKWVFITSTYDYNNGTVKHYINGNYIASLNIGSVEQSTNGNAFTGKVPWDGRAVNGLISDLQIYNTALTPQEIQYLYQEGLGGAPIRLGSLVGWWPLNGDAKDYSGNNNHGTINGGVTFVQNYNPP